MGVPISIRLDGDVRDELEAQARRNGVGLATLLREVATGAARDVRRATRPHPCGELARGGSCRRLRGRPGLL